MPFTGAQLRYVMLGAWWSRQACTYPWLKKRSGGTRKLADCIPQEIAHMVHIFTSCEVVSRLLTKTE